MAMTTAGLQALLETTFIAAFPSEIAAGIPTSAYTPLAAAIANAIVPYIQANAEVLPTGLISATPGDPVTGTGTIV